MRITTRAAILFVLAVVLAPVFGMFLLFISLAGGEFLCASINRGSHEGMTDLCQLLAAAVLVVVLVVGSLSAYALGRRRWR